MYKAIYSGYKSIYNYSRGPPCMKMNTPPKFIVYVLAHIAWIYVFCSGHLQCHEAKQIPLPRPWAAKKKRGSQQKYLPGDSKWPVYPPVGGHQTFPEGHLTIPTRSQRIGRCWFSTFSSCLGFCFIRCFFDSKKRCLNLTKGPWINVHPNWF